jgi:hypothetical protein
MVPTWMAVSGAVAGLVAGGLTGFYISRLIGAALRYGRHSLASTTPVLTRTSPVRERNPQPNTSRPRTRSASGGWADDSPTDHLFRRPAPAAVRPYVARHAWPDDEA